MARKTPAVTDSFYAYARDYDLISTGVPGDVPYFAKLAASAKRVLELACGTGRVTIPMAEAGAKVTGIDLNGTMLDLARDKLAKAPPKARARVTLQEGDMRDFDLGDTFPLIVIPYRAFQHLLTVADQRACLACCRKHLAPRGRLVINLFDPNLRILAASMEPGRGNAVQRVADAIDPEHGDRVMAWASRVPGPEEQMIQEDWVIERFDRTGQSIARHLRQLRLRYIYRYEMEHLLELEGLRVEKLEGGFDNQPYRHGAEQIWTALKA